MSRRAVRLEEVKGVTLVELLMALAVLAILGTISAAVLNAGVSSWTHAQQRVALQQVADAVIEGLLEGGFEEDGLKDAVELRDAAQDAVSIVPLWTDRSHVPDPLKNKPQRFTLEKQFKAGAATPVGQVRERGSDDWVSVPLSFDYGAGADPLRPDDVVTFTEPIPPGASLKLLYTPDAQIHSETQIRFWWEADLGTVFRSYAGSSRPLVRQMRGVRIERLAFLYYDNLNRLLPMGRSYTASELRRITGVKVYLLLSRTEGWSEVTSFTNIRNVQTIGVTITVGSRLPLPSPQEIKAFSLGDFHGLRGEGLLELVVTTDERPRWKIRLEFAPGSESDQIILNRFQIEAPPGTIRTAMILNQAIAQNEFVNLLGLDRSGLYDYDDDPDLRDVVLVKGASPVVEVTQADFDVVSLFIRP
jgi:prepilin-type N-terminal cleavage/methylation domain-containing protein